MRLQRPLEIPPPFPNRTCFSHLSALAARNRTFDAGRASSGPARRPLRARGRRRFVPATEFLIVLHALSAGDRQDTLQHLFEFQCDDMRRTGSPTPASHDGATAVAEAVAMAHRSPSEGRSSFRATSTAVTAPSWKSLLRHLGGRCRRGRPRKGGEDRIAMNEAQSAHASWCWPGLPGRHPGSAPIAEKAHAAGARSVAAFTEAVSLGLVQLPGVCGCRHSGRQGPTSARRRLPGGPNVGLFATREKFDRGCRARPPARPSTSRAGAASPSRCPTREQHIRREKATSTFAPTRVLCVARVHYSPDVCSVRLGLHSAREHQSCKCCGTLADKLSKNQERCEVRHRMFFNEFTDLACQRTMRPR